MRLFVFGLTGLVVIALLWQFFEKKGTNPHVIRGVFIGLGSILVVIVNTFDVSRTRGLNWDTYFIIHVAFGTYFFVSLLLTCILGLLTKYRNINKFWHRFGAINTAFALTLTLLVAVATRIFR